ncbi:MAG TPA: MmgE/PrpD family protein [Baekduia sp.]|nr:MmgE/PrpD family protein [Baekduia sp.]
MTSAGHRGEDALVAFVSELRFDDVPPAAVEAVLGLVLDQITCALVGTEMDWTRRLRSVVAPPTAAVPAVAGDAATIIGDDALVAPEVAALVNGTAGHGFDLDDLHFGTMSHPGCVVIPAALAMAEATGADGRALLTAVVAGYEPMLRTGLAAGLRYGELGFHATGVLGPLGAATAAARLLGAPVVDALGLAASLGAGIKAFNEVGPGMVKRLHAGRAAEAGILAARLAAAGYEGPRRALTARFGLTRVLALGEAPDVGALDRELGEPFVVEDIYIKPYAACGALHGAVHAAQQIAQARPGLRDADVREVVVGASPRALAQNSDIEPVDVMAAQYSTEVAVAIALLGGATDPRRFMAAGDDAADPARVLARRTRLEVDEQAAATYPDPMEGVVTVRLRDGTTLARRGSSSPASSRGWDVAAAKFDAVTAGRVSPDVRGRVRAAVRALADGGPVADCLRPLAGQTAGRP